MAVSTTPGFASTPKHAMVQIATANTNRDGTGTLGTLLTGGTNGSKIERIVIQATGTTTAGMIRFYIYDGTNTRLVDEQPVSAVTPSASVEAFSAEITYTIPSLFLLTDNNEQIKVSTHNAETFNIHCFYGNF